MGEALHLGTPGRMGRLDRCAPEMTTRLRVVTYNIHKCRGLDRRVDPDRIATVLSQFDADVIALQEILDAQSGKPEWDQARRIHAKFPGYQRCLGENRPLRGGFYRNMTLSRFPVHGAS